MKDQYFARFDICRLIYSAKNVKTKEDSQSGKVTKRVVR